MTYRSNIETHTIGLATAADQASPNHRDLSQTSTPTRPNITLSDIKQQIRRDIETKEVQTSPTYSYQWMADQVGHMALGMLSVLVLWSIGELFHLARTVDVGIWPPIIGFVIIAVFAFYKEFRDYQGAIAKIGPEPLFNATRDRKDLRNNAIIAFYYMCLGGIIALAALLSAPALNKMSSSLLVLIPMFVTMFVIFALCIAAPAVYWLVQKIRYQQIGLPFLFRLPEFKLEGFSRDDAKKIDQFIWESGSGTAKHIALVGSLNSGKTTLAVGIATEASFNGKKARYLTLDKLQQIVAMRVEPPAPRNTVLWPWKRSEILIIDDVTAGIPHSTAEHPEQLRKELQDLGEEARTAIRQRNTVWCLGAELSDAKRWTKALEEGCGITGMLTVQLRKIP